MMVGPPGPPTQWAANSTSWIVTRRSLIAAHSFPVALDPNRVITPPGGEIASILVQARPECLVDVEAAIAAIPGCEIHGRDPKGKLVVVVDAPDAGVIGTTLNTSRCCPTSTPPRSFSTPSTSANAAPARNRHDRSKADRRQVLKWKPPPWRCAVGGIPMPALAANLVTERAENELKWDKAPCRFCGTGCSVMVATKENRVVATHGDIKSEVNRGLNCVKGYFLSKIMYGHDRLTRPMLRKTTASTTRTASSRRCLGTKPSTSWRRSSRTALKKRGPSGVGMFGSGQWTIWEGYAAAQAAARPASAPTTSIRTRATAWRPRPSASCAPSA